MPTGPWVWILPSVPRSPWSPTPAFPFPTSGLSVSHVYSSARPAGTFWAFVLGLGDPMEWEGKVLDRIGRQGPDSALAGEADTGLDNSKDRGLSCGHRSPWTEGLLCTPAPRTRPNGGPDELAIRFCSCHWKLGWEPLHSDTQDSLLANHEIVHCKGYRQDLAGATLGAPVYWATEIPDGLGRWATVLGVWGWCLFPPLGSLE